MTASYLALLAVSEDHFEQLYPIIWPFFGTKRASGLVPIYAFTFVSGKRAMRLALAVVVNTKMPLLMEEKTLDMLLMKLELIEAAASHAAAPAPSRKTPP